MEITKYFATLCRLTWNRIPIEENFHEKMKKEENTEAKRNVTLHILNCRLTSFAGEGDPRFGAKLIGNGQHLL